MKILIAPDKFKGSLTAAAVCQAIMNGIHRFDPAIECILHPLADGGEGSLEMLRMVTASKTITRVVLDPLFRPVEASYLRDDQVAYIELAAASGLELLKPEERNCLYTTTYGTGELILDAIQNGATRLFLFVGGSATNEAGLGMAAALGYRFLDQNGVLLSPIGNNLGLVDRIDPTALKCDPGDLEITVACDVRNTLFGKEGAAYVYAPQKGADGNAVALLDHGLMNISRVIQKDLGMDVSRIEGGGAAGGIGAGGVAFLGASIRPGIDTIMQITGFEDKLQGVDLVITGEGKVDEQTVRGKVVKGVAEQCRQKNVPVGVICGRMELEEEKLKQLGVKIWGQVLTGGITPEQAVNEAGDRVADLAFRMMQDLA